MSPNAWAESVAQGKISPSDLGMKKKLWPEHQPRKKWYQRWGGHWFGSWSNLGSKRTRLGSGRATPPSPGSDSGSGFGKKGKSSDRSSDFSMALSPFHVGEMQPQHPKLKRRFVDGAEMDSARRLGSDSQELPSYRWPYAEGRCRSQMLKEGDTLPAKYRALEDGTLGGPVRAHMDSGYPYRGALGEMSGYQRQDAIKEYPQRRRHGKHHRSERQEARMEGNSAFEDEFGSDKEAHGL